MTNCENCKHDLPHTWNHECNAGILRLRDCNKSIMLVCSSFEKGASNNKRAGLSFSCFHLL